MADYEQKIFEQVIDSYFCESQNNEKLGNYKNERNRDIHHNGKKSTNENVDAKNSSASAKKKRESKCKAVLIGVAQHENLPTGWKKVVVQRTTGATAGKFDVYFFTPSGRKLRSKNEIKDYSEKHNLDLDLSNFGFSRPRKDGFTLKVPCKKSKSIIIDDSSNLTSVLSCSSIEFSDSSNHIDSKVSFPTDDADSVNGDSCASGEIQLGSLIDQDMRAFAEEVLEQSAIELNLPNTSFTNVPFPNSLSTSIANVKTEVLDTENNISNNIDINVDENELSYLGKTFKIERPLSFSCF